MRRHRPIPRRRRLRIARPSTTVLKNCFCAAASLNALNELLRAQAEVRRREVQQQANGQGGRGANRQQQDNLNNNSGTPSAPDSLGEDRGTTGGSGTLTPTTPNDSLSGDDNDGGLGSSGSSGGGLSGGDSGD